MQVPLSCASTSETSVGLNLMFDSASVNFRSLATDIWAYHRCVLYVLIYTILACTHVFTQNTSLLQGFEARRAIRFGSLFGTRPGDSRLTRGSRRSYTPCTLTAPCHGCATHAWAIIGELMVKHWGAVLAVYRRHLYRRFNRMY